MQYSPKLKKAASEIQEILNKHDIAGVIVLHTPGHGEFLNHFSPSYSAARFENIPEEENQIGLRIKIKAADVGTKKAKQLAEDTTNIFHVLCDIVGRQALSLIDMSEYMEKHYNPDHSGPGFTSSSSQQN